MRRASLSTVWCACAFAGAAGAPVGVAGARVDVQPGLSVVVDDGSENKTFSFPETIVSRIGLGPEQVELHDVPVVTLEEAEEAEFCALRQNMDRQVEASLREKYAGQIVLLEAWNEEACEWPDRKPDEPEFHWFEAAAFAGTLNATVVKFATTCNEVYAAGMLHEGTRWTQFADRTLPGAALLTALDESLPPEREQLLRLLRQGHTAMGSVSTISNPFAESSKLWVAQLFFGGIAPVLYGMVSLRSLQHFVARNSVHTRLRTGFALKVVLISNSVIGFSGAVLLFRDGFGVKRELRYHERFVYRVMWFGWGVGLDILVCSVMHEIIRPRQSTPRLVLNACAILVIICDLVQITVVTSQRVGNFLLVVVPAVFALIQVVVAAALLRLSYLVVRSVRHAVDFHREKNRGDDSFPSDKVDTWAQEVFLVRTSRALKTASLSAFLTILYFVVVALDLGYFRHAAMFHTSNAVFLIARTRTPSSLVASCASVGLCKLIIPATKPGPGELRAGSPVAAREARMFGGSGRAAEAARVAGRVLAVLPVAVMVRDCVADYCFISGVSMQPTLNPYPDAETLRKYYFSRYWRDVVLVDRFSVRSGSYKRGSVVLFRSAEQPDRLLIKRLIGLEGDWVVNRKGHYVHIGKGHCWVEGDNTEHSIDSNQYGPIPLALITGRVSHVIWPPWRWEPVAEKRIDPDALAESRSRVRRRPYQIDIDLDIDDDRDDEPDGDLLRAVLDADGVDLLSKDTLDAAVGAAKDLDQGLQDDDDAGEEIE
ncbi:Mitochondrial inner membrane protease subunit 2 (IMP2-like protein) [Durusdinium trenchii]|uniref:Mitochondrial inner membrane protease subunit 2 n=1 Tax=Durusdinium trenchii TaxID=1381693 RepID=A0ABP0HPI7_9DINO